MDNTRTIRIYTIFSIYRTCIRIVACLRATQYKHARQQSGDWLRPISEPNNAGAGSGHRTCEITTCQLQARSLFIALLLKDLDSPNRDYISDRSMIGYHSILSDVSSVLNITEDLEIKKLILFRNIFCHDQDPDQDSDQDFTLNFNAKTTFDTIKRLTKFDLNIHTFSKVIVSTDRWIDR